MVKVAVAGGSGQVAREVIDVLVATKKHEIIILSRKEPNPEEVDEGTTWAKVDYSDKDSLVQALQGVDVVLSFIVAHLDPGGIAQKSLIDAAIDAGVKRFAPSEWASSDLSATPWYAGKIDVREYLKEVNREKKVLEYTLFQPGLFLNYLASPHQTTRHIVPLGIQYDFANRRAIVVDGADDDSLTLTTAQDLGGVVARAIEFDGEWPVVGGINGNTVNSAQILALGEEIRGKPFDVEKLNLEDLKAGEPKSTWIPELKHPSLSEDQVAQFSKAVIAASLVGQAQGAWVVSDEWNKLLPDYQFTGIKEFLSDVWTGKP